MEYCLIDVRVVTSGGGGVFVQAEDGRRDLVRSRGLGDVYKRQGLPPSKKLSSCVRPGVFDVLARLLRLVSALSNDDFPTFDRPAKATSLTVGSGRNSSLSLIHI